MVTTKRKTFVVPDGHEVVKDIDGRATGETQLKQEANLPVRSMSQNMRDQETAQKMGAELLLEAIAEPNLNRYLDGNPKTTFKSDDDWREFVTILQKKRALFITAEQKKKEPKEDEE